MGLKSGEVFAKLSVFIHLSSTLNKNKQKKTINTALISSHIFLKNSVSDFWNVRPLYFYKQIYSGMRNYTASEK